MNNEPIDYPIRINRYLHLTGLCSRRQADRLIEQGEVFINGKAAVLGQQVQESDKVTLGSAATALPATYKYYLYHKPIGIVSTNAQRDEIDAVTDAQLPKEFAPVGRLDKASEGLMLLTNDGRIVNKLLNPEFAHERTYEVTVDKYIKEHDLKILGRGVDIEGYRTKPAKAQRLDETTFLLTLTEGKKHQVRRMCAALGYQVVTLKRTDIMHLTLTDLAPSEARALTEQQRDELLTKLGVVH